MSCTYGAVPYVQSQEHHRNNTATAAERIVTDRALLREASKARAASEERGGRRTHALRVAADWVLQEAFGRGNSNELSSQART